MKNKEISLKYLALVVSREEFILWVSLKHETPPAVPGK